MVIDGAIEVLNFLNFCQLLNRNKLLILIQCCFQFQIKSMGISACCKHTQSSSNKQSLLEDFACGLLFIHRNPLFELDFHSDAFPSCSLSFLTLQLIFYYPALIKDYEWS